MKGSLGWADKVNDFFFSFNPGCAEIADEVYMEVIVGEEEATSLPDTQIEDSGVNKTFVPVAWAAAYGRNLYAYFLQSYYFLSNLSFKICVNVIISHFPPGVWKQLLLIF